MCPLIRICEFTTAQAEELRKLFEQLATGQTTQIALHESPIFNLSGGLCLTLRTHREDLGIRRPSDRSRAFELLLTPETFADLAAFTLPFEQEEQTVAFQWLVERGEVNLLLSTNGRW